MHSHASAIPRAEPVGPATGRPSARPARAGVPADAAWRVLAAVVLAGAACWLAWSLWTSRGYVPIWDARVYADCAVRAATAPFSPAALSCAAHPTHAYLAVLATLQRLSPGSMPLLLAANALLLALGAVAFARLLRETFPDTALGPERTLVLAALLLDPVIVAGAVQINPDFGILVFLLVASAAAAAGWFRTAALFGFLACFSKETGAVLYGALLASFALALLLPARVPRPTRNALLAAPLAVLLLMVVLPWEAWSLPVGAVAGVAVLRLLLGDAWQPRATAARLARAMPLAVMALPLAAVVAHMAWKASQPSATAVWRGMEVWFALRLLATPHFLPESVTHLGQLLVLNFHWIVGGALAADLLVGARRFATGQPPRAVPGAEPRVLRAVTLFGIAGLFLVTRIPTAPIARYVMPLFPVLLALFLAALLRLGVPAAVRRATLATLALLFGLSIHRTIDPVAKRLWGTYPVGAHALVRTNAALHRPNLGLDEGVYNLEFLRIAELSQRALDHLQPVAGKVLVTGYHADWNVVGPLDARGQRRLGGRPLRAPTLAYAEDLIAGRVRPDSAWYLAYPNLTHAPLLRQLSARYAVGAPDTIRTDGYAMSVLRLTRRDAAAAR